MSENLDHFVKWFKEPLNRLYENNDAGFAILIISLPLLERFLREKSGVCQNPRLDSRFHDALLQMFPSLCDPKVAEEFWEIYRHGLLHQATLKTKDRTLDVNIHNDAWPEVVVSITAEGRRFTISAVEFSKKVVKEIELDFKTFEAEGSPEHPLPGIDPTRGRSGHNRSK